MEIKIGVHGYDVDASVDYNVLGKFLPATETDPAEYPEIEPTKLYLSDGTDVTVLLNNSGICDIIVDSILDKLEANF